MNSNGDLNSATKISQLDEKMEVITTKTMNIDQDGGAQELVRAYREARSLWKKNLLLGKIDNIGDVTDKVNNNSKIKFKSDMGEAYLDTDWNEYGVVNQGGMTVPYLWTDYPKDIPIAKADPDTWNDMGNPNAIIPCRRVAINGWEKDGGYTMSLPAMHVLNTLQQNASLDELGNVFGKQELSVFSSNLALAFNTVSTKFSTETLFLRALLYLNQHHMTDQRANVTYGNVMVSSPFQGVKRVSCELAGSVGDRKSVV